MCNKDLVGRGGTDRCHSNLMAKFIWKETMASVVQQRHRNWLSWLGLRRNLKKIVKKMLSESGTGTEAQRAHTRRRPTQSPGAFLPSSSPMRSSFQVQQNSINLIHPPMQSSGREPAASVWRISGVSEQLQRSQAGGRVASCGFLRHVFCGASFKTASDQ